MTTLSYIKSHFTLPLRGRGRLDLGGPRARVAASAMMTPSSAATRPAAQSEAALRILGEAAPAQHEEGEPRTKTKSPA